LTENIVRKGTAEFTAASKQYLKLYFESGEEDLIRKGEFAYGEHKGKCLGFTSKKIEEAKLPMPFGCPDLFIQPCFETVDKDKLTERQILTGVIWFCDRAGCICVCCREDFTNPKEEYPTYCPSASPEFVNQGEEDFDAEDSADEWEDD